MRSRFFIVQFLLAATTCVAEMPVPKADETGMVPADLILGNMNSFPGHAGIYLGKWKKLPAPLRTKYARLYDDIIIYSRNEALRDSFLIIDSYMPWVGIRSFAEQFTNYYTGHGRRVLNPTGALSWESKRGGAIQYHDPWKRPGSSLPIADRRRWKILDEALMCAQKRVGYAQERLLGIFPKYWDMMKEKIKDKPNYKAFKIDCITFCHWVHWRGAKIDLSSGSKLLPVMLPGDYDTMGHKYNLYRAVLLEPVYVEAALLGKWKGTRIVTNPKGTRTQECAYEVLIHPTEEGKFYFYPLHPTTLERRGRMPDPAAVAFERQPSDQLYMRAARRSTSGSYAYTGRYDPKNDRLTYVIKYTGRRGHRMTYSCVMNRAKYVKQP